MTESLLFVLLFLAMVFGVYKITKLTNKLALTYKVGVSKTPHLRPITEFDFEHRPPEVKMPQSGLTTIEPGAFTKAREARLQLDSPEKNNFKPVVGQVVRFQRGCSKRLARVIRIVPNGFWLLPFTGGRPRFRSVVYHRKDY